WTREEITLVEAFAGRCWAEVERARAEQALHAAAARDAFRVKLSDALRDISDTAEIQYQAARVLGEHFGAHRVAYWLIESDEFFVIDREWVNGAPAMPKRFSFSGVDPASREDLRAGRPLVRDDVREDPRLSAEEKAMRVSVGAVSGATVPLRKD